MNTQRYYDELMKQYYALLINTWDAQRKAALRSAIQMLSDIPRSEKLNEKIVKAVENQISDIMINDWKLEISKATSTITDQVYRIGLAESGYVSGKQVTQIGYAGLDNRYSRILASQNLFWMQNHHSEGLGADIRAITIQAIQHGMTANELAVKFKQTFEDAYGGNAFYYQKLAEHSMLRVRELARITGYEKAGAASYTIVAVIDERTSDICLALNGQTFPIEQAVATRDAMLDVDLASGPESAKEYLKRVAPWVSEKQVVYRDEKPVGITGNHTPFPPFHWGCRTQTQMNYEGLS